MCRRTKASAGGGATGRKNGVSGGNRRGGKYASGTGGQKLDGGEEKFVQGKIGMRKMKKKCGRVDRRAGEVLRGWVDIVFLGGHGDIGRRHGWGRENLVAGRRRPKSGISGAGI